VSCRQAPQAKISPADADPHTYKSSQVDSQRLNQHGADNRNGKYRCQQAGKCCDNGYVSHTTIFAAHCEDFVKPAAPFWSRYFVGNIRHRQFDRSYIVVSALRLGSTGPLCLFHASADARCPQKQRAFFIAHPAPWYTRGHWSNQPPPLSPERQLNRQILLLVVGQDRLRREIFALSDHLVDLGQ
jgi:hypothetical protein